MTPFAGSVSPLSFCGFGRRDRPFWRKRRGADEVFLSAPPRSRAFCRTLEKEVQRGSGCTSRIAGTVASSPRAPPFPARRPWRVARHFPADVGNGRGMEARQGAVRIFFRNPVVLRGAPQPIIPASPDARSREPPPCTTAAGTRRPFRAWRLCKIARQVFVEAGPVRFRQASPPADDGNGHDTESVERPPPEKRAGHLHRGAGGMVLKTRIRWCGRLVPVRPGRSAGDPHPSQKNSHGILPRLPPSTVPAASREDRSAPGVNGGPTP
jgi:hypothetical protein